jgi:hypothetical protein
MHKVTNTGLNVRISRYVKVRPRLHSIQSGRKAAHATPRLMQYTLLGYELHDRRIGVQFSAAVKFSIFYTTSNPALGPTEPPIKCVSRSLSPGESGRDVKLANRLNLMLSLNILGAITLLFPCGLVLN